MENVQRAQVTTEMGGRTVFVSLEADTPGELRRAVEDFLGLDKSAPEPAVESVVKPPQRRPRKPKVTAAKQVILCGATFRFQKIRTRRRFLETRTR